MITISYRKNATGEYAVFATKSYLGGARFAQYKAAIDGARFDGEERVNIAPLSAVLPILARLKDAGFEGVVDAPLLEALKRLTTQQQLFRESATKRADVVDAQLRKRGLSLYAYQKIGIEWLAGRQTALLADEPGLGKSCQALTSVPYGSPILVICPSVMKSTWIAEAKKWREDVEKSEVISGRGKFRWPAPKEIVAINYDILPEVIEGTPAPLTTLIIDEVHACKNYKSLRSQRTEAVKRRVRGAGGRVVGLTATPLINDPGDLWSVLQVCDCAHECFGSYGTFFELMAGTKDKWGSIRWGKPKDEVGERLRRVSLRREKKDVLTDLPEKRWQVIEVPIDRTTKKLADKAWKEIKDAGLDLEAAETFAKLQDGAALSLDTVSKARQALAVAKLPSLLELVESYESAGEPIVVFSRHRGPIDVLASRPGWAAITGDNSSQAGAVAAEFQAGKLKGLAGTIQAAGVGITLTRASTMIFVDRDWTPALNDQAEDRCHRIGQREALLVIVLEANHSMDKHVRGVVSRKQKIIKATVQASAVDGETRPREDAIEDADGFTMGEDA